MVLNSLKTKDKHGWTVYCFLLLTIESKKSMKLCVDLESQKSSPAIKTLTFYRPIYSCVLEFRVFECDGIRKASVSKTTIFIHICTSSRCERASVEALRVFLHHHLPLLPLLLFPSSFLCPRLHDLL